jgi:hypothetical protein
MFNILCVLWIHRMLNKLNSIEYLTLFRLSPFTSLGSCKNWKLACFLWSINYYYKYPPQHPSLPKLETYLRSQHYFSLPSTSFNLLRLNLSYEIGVIFVYSLLVSLNFYHHQIVVSITICCPKWSDIKNIWMTSSIYQNTVNPIYYSNSIMITNFVQTLIPNYQFEKVFPAYIFIWYLWNLSNTHSSSS